MQPAMEILICFYENRGYMARWQVNGSIKRIVSGVLKSVPDSQEMSHVIFKQWLPILGKNIELPQFPPSVEFLLSQSKTDRERIVELENEIKSLRSFVYSVNYKG